MSLTEDFITSEYLENVTGRKIITNYSKLKMEKLQNIASPLALQEINAERRHCGPGPTSLDGGASDRHILLL